MLDAGAQHIVRPIGISRASSCRNLRRPDVVAGTPVIVVCHSEVDVRRKDPLGKEKKNQRKWLLPSGPVVSLLGVLDVGGEWKQVHVR